MLEKSIQEKMGRPPKAGAKNQAAEKNVPKNAITASTESKGNLSFASSGSCLRWSRGELFFINIYCIYIYIEKGKKTETRQKKVAGITLYTGHFLQTEKTTRLHRCAKHFLHTLDISEQTVTTALNKHDVNPIIQEDNRGGNRIHQEDEKQHIREHIESFPVVDSHNCRQTTKRQYLGANLNVSMMHRLYMEAWRAVNKTPVSLRTYRDVFNTEYNLGFHRPSKDLCGMCTQYTNMSEEDRRDMQEDYDRHLSDHNQVTRLKQSYKDRSAQDSSFTLFRV